MFNRSTSNYSFRKWFGAILILIEVFTSSSTIYGFSALFSVLAQQGVYHHHCTIKDETDSPSKPSIDCTGQTKQYQNAATLGIILFDISAVFVGMLSDWLGARLIKLIAMILHVIGWLSLALIKPGRDYLLYIHAACTSLSGTMLVMAAYVSCGYFSKSRACLSSLYAGSGIAAAIWYSIFKIFIEANRITLKQISFIWMSLGFLMSITTFLNLDWRFHRWNLPYQFDTTLERSISDNQDTQIYTILKGRRLKWYENITHRQGIWEHLTSPIYILIVLFLSILFTSVGLLSIIWYPWVLYIVGDDVDSADKYTFIFNMLTLVSFVICPLNGFFLGFRAERSRKQQFLNISIAQTITWIVSILSCVLSIFASRTMILPVMIFNNIAHALVEGGSQAALAACFPARYIGTLCGLMWTFNGIVSLIHYGLVELTHDVPMSWRAWIIVLVLMVLASSHLIQMWSKYRRERRKLMSVAEDLRSELSQSPTPVTWF